MAKSSVPLFLVQRPGERKITVPHEVDALGVSGSANPGNGFTEVDRPRQLPDRNH